MKNYTTPIRDRFSRGGAAHADFIRYIRLGREYESEPELEPCAKLLWSLGRGCCDWYHCGHRAPSHQRHDSERCIDGRQDLKTELVFDVEYCNWLQVEHGRTSDISSYHHYFHFEPQIKQLVDTQGSLRASAHGGFKLAAYGVLHQVEPVILRHGSRLWPFECNGLIVFVGNSSTFGLFLT